MKWRKRKARWRKIKESKDETSNWSKWRKKKTRQIEWYLINCFTKRKSKYCALDLHKIYGDNIKDVQKWTEGAIR